LKIWNVELGIRKKETRPEGPPGKRNLKVANVKNERKVANLKDYSSDVYVALQVEAGHTPRLHKRQGPRIVGTRGKQDLQLHVAGTPLSCPRTEKSAT